MGKLSRPRKGSLQFYPRKRAAKVLPRVKWGNLTKSDSGLKGFIGYKSGMVSVYVRDNTPHSLTKGQRIVIPATVIECPTIRILSVRFYNDNILIGEVLSKNLDKELKRKIKIPKKETKKIEDFKTGSYNDIKVLIYTQVKKTEIKKTPDIHEVGLSGSIQDKLDFVKNNLLKELSIKDVFKEGIVDVRGVTKGKGNQGPVKRFGLTLRSHKAEKGQRFHGSGGPWHPSRVEFTQPMAGQMGYFTRVTYNNKIIAIGNVNDKDSKINPEFKHYGKIINDYIVLFGSIQGPGMRPLLITSPLRPSKKQSKKSYEIMEYR